MANKSGRRSSWLELELTVTTIKTVTVRSNLNYYILALKPFSVGVGQITPGTGDWIAYSTPSLPLIPEQACHPFQTKAATDSRAKLPPWQIV